MHQPAGAPEQLAGLVWIPISPATKQPRVKFKRAVVSSWKPRPGDGFGVLTGPSTMTDQMVWGLDLDIDDEGAQVLGGAGFLQLDAYISDYGHSWSDLETLTVKTASGGMHLYFLMEPDRWVRGGAGHTELGPDVDVRGGRMVNGEVAGTGYLKAPPSAGYEVVKDVPMIAAPDWLYDAVKWEPPAARKRRSGSPSAVPRSALARAISSGTGDPLGRAQTWVRRAVEVMTGELEELWDQDHGWRTVALSVTASLAGLVENDVLAELGVTSEEWAWEVMEAWAELMDDGEGFYEKHLEPMFLSKLGCASPARLPDDLEDALLDRLQPEEVVVEVEDEAWDDEFDEPEAEPFDYDALTLTDEVDPPVEWLLPHLLVKGMLNCITGPPKSVKSTIAGFLGSRVGSRVVWVSRDGEHRGSIQRRLQAAGLTGQARILEESHTPTPKILMERLADLAEWAGPEGLFIFDSLAGVNKILGGENEYSNAASRTLWDSIHKAVGGVTILLVAHASMKDDSNAVMGSQAIHQILVHLLRAKRDENGLVTVRVEFSRYGVAGSTLLTGQLPGQDPADTPPIIELEFEQDGMLLIAKEKPGGDLRAGLASAIALASGVDAGDEATLEEWPRHSGLSSLQIVMAQSSGLLEIREGSKKGKVSLHTTPLYDYTQSLLSDALVDEVEDDW